MLWCLHGICFDYLERGTSNARARLMSSMKAPEREVPDVAKVSANLPILAQSYLRQQQNFGITSIQCS